MITNLDRANWADKAILAFREQTACDHEGSLRDLLGEPQLTIRLPGEHWGTHNGPALSAESSASRQVTYVHSICGIFSTFRNDRCIN